jgi:hypothetical protein
MQSDWISDRRQFEDLKRRLELLEETVAEEQKPNQGWLGNLRLDISSVTCRGRMKRVGKGLVIALDKHHWKDLELENLENGEVIERCVAIRVNAYSDDIENQAYEHWMEYVQTLDPEPYMMASTHFHKREDGNYQTEEEVGRFRGSEDISLGLDDAMQGYCLDSTINYGYTMLCKMCLRKGDYLRLYISKGWSDYFLKGRDNWDDSIKVDVDICSLEDSERLDGLDIPMRCRYQRIDDGSGKSIRVKLPSWFKTIRGGALLERPEFTCKILHAYQTNKSNTLTMKVYPNSTQIKPQAVVFKKIKDRAELRYPMMHNIDEQLPLGKGFLDLQLRL